MAANHRIRADVMERKIVCPKCGTENLSWQSRCQSCGAELHPDERAIPKFEARGAGFWVTFLLGLVGTGFFGGLTYAAMAFPEQGEPIFLLLVAVPVVGLSLCWKWQLAGGILLVIGSFLPQVGIMSIPDVGRDPFLVIGLGLTTLFITFPLVLSDIMFAKGR
jgi:predicted RNA-binding Zn-ribbon protein involved in translation (DUF1610 family)